MYTTRFDMQPLVDLVEKNGGIKRCTSNPSTQRVYHRAKRNQTISWWTADTLAVQILQMHPREIWGNTPWDQIEHEQRERIRAKNRRQRALRRLRVSG